MHQYLYSCIKIFICLTPSHWIEVNECMSYDRSGRILKNSICLCLFLWLISHLVHLLASEPIGSTLLALLICFPAVIVILDCGMFAKILSPSTLSCVSRQQSLKSLKLQNNVLISVWCYCYYQNGTIYLISTSPLLDCISINHKPYCGSHENKPKTPFSNSSKIPLCAFTKVWKMH